MPDDKTAPKPADRPPAATTQPAADSLEPTAPNPVQAPKPAAVPDAKTSGPIKKALTIVNIYMAIFILVVLAAAAVVYVSIKPAKVDTTTPLGKLSDQQLSALKTNSTLVGDPKQTLDIQSNTILEGQVLARNDLNVAGSLKVGGALSLPAITVTGSGNFAQIGTTGALSVGGDADLQGQLTVRKNLNVSGTASFGNLSVATLSVTSLQVKNDFSLSKHIVTSGGTPGRTNGTALGSGGTVSVGGTDTAGTVSINTGGSPPAGLFVTITFTQKFATTPHVVITPVGSSAAGLQYYINRDANGFSIGTLNAPPSSANFAFDYIVIE